MTHASLKMQLSRGCVVPGFGGVESRVGEDVTHNLLLSTSSIHEAALALLGHPGILWVTSRDPVTRIHSRVSY